MGFASFHSFLEISVLLYAGYECLLVCLLVGLFLEDDKKKKTTNKQTNNTIMFTVESNY